MTRAPPRLARALAATALVAAARAASWTPSSWTSAARGDAAALVDVGHAGLDADALAWRCPFDGDLAATSLDEDLRNGTAGDAGPGDVIFFVHTSPETGDAPPTALCAVESAARQNPTARVRVVSSAWTGLGGLEDRLGNVRLVRVDLGEVFEVLPVLKQWYASRAWAAGHQYHHLSDALRLALLYGCGGTYLDTDIITTTDLGAVGARAFMGIEQHADPERQVEASICNAVLRFKDRRRTFVRTLIESFTKSFDANKFFGWNGPQLLSRVWTARDPREAALDKVHIFPAAAFYAIPWYQVGTFFDDRVGLDDYLDSAQRREFPLLGAHLWQSQVRGQLALVGSEYRGSLVGQLYARFCPATLRSQWRQSAPSPEEGPYKLRIEEPRSGLQVFGQEAIEVRMNIEARDEDARKLLQDRLESMRLCLSIHGDNGATCYPLDEARLRVPNPGRGFHMLEARLCAEDEIQACEAVSSACKAAEWARAYASFSVDFHSIQAAKAKT